MKSRPKLLAIIHLPPPMHGASLMGVLFVNSKRINEVFSLKTINLAVGKDISRANKFDLYKVFDSVAIFLKCFRELIFNRPDVVYVTANSAGLSFWKDFLIILLLKVFCVKHCMHYHNKGFIKYDQSFIGRLILRVYFWKSTPILLSKHLVYDLKITKNFIKLRFCPPATDANIGYIKNENCGRKLQLLFLSNLIREKGVIEILEASRILTNKGILFEFVIAGQPGDITVDFLNSEISRLGINHCVSYIGPVFGEQKKNLYETVDAFVFPTYYHRECFPLVLLEAMSYQLPIVATNEAAIPEIILEGENGYLVERMNSLDLAIKLELLMTDPVKMKQMGVLSKAIFESTYTVDCFDQRMTDILLEVSN